MGSAVVASFVPRRATSGLGRIATWELSEVARSAVLLFAVRLQSSLCVGGMCCFDLLNSSSFAYRGASLYV